ncbi:MAG: hypothetical protein WCF68_08800 [Terriglobales bacterium]
MRLSWRIWIALVLIACSTGMRAQDPATFSGTPSPAQIESWLKSDDLRQKAWAATYILKAEDKSFVPALVAQLEHWPPESSDPPKEYRDRYGMGPDQQFAGDAILDALIQMHGDVPASILQRVDFAQNFPDQVFILLARMPPQDSEPALLALYNHPFYPRLAGALLALHPPADFAASLFTSTTIHLHLDVVLPEDPGVGRPGSVCVVSACLSGEVPGPKPGWPSIFAYMLEDERGMPHPDAFLVAPGIRPILGERFEVKAKTVGNCGCCGDDCFYYFAQQVRLDLLAQMLNLHREDLGIDEWGRVLRPANRDEYLQAVVALVDEYEKKFANIEKSLKQKGLMPAQEKGHETALPRLELQLEDVRSKKDYPLPQIPFCSSYVHWTDKNGTTTEDKSTSCVMGCVPGPAPHGNGRIPSPLDPKAIACPRNSHLSLGTR